MSIMDEVHALEAKLEGAAKEAIAYVKTALAGDKAKIIADLEAEVAKASPELQTLWAKLKAHL